MVATSHQMTKKGTKMKRILNLKSQKNISNIFGAAATISMIILSSMTTYGQVRGDLVRPGRGGGVHVQVADSRVVIEKSRALSVQLRNNGHLLSPRSIDQINQLLDQALDLSQERGDGHQPPRYDDGLVSMTAECHIDDDPQFDFNQRVAGEVTGQSVQQILNECDSIARYSGLNVFSSGIKDLKITSSVRGLVVAECHIDDDPQFDANQLVVGKIAARSIEEVAHSCSLVAKHIYKGRGSSGLVNVRRN